MKLEICVDSVQSAENAMLGGCDRLELCSLLNVGGITPSVGLLQSVLKCCQRLASDGRSLLPVFCLLRPRPGNFTYSLAELEVMIADACALRAAGASGFVFGCLNVDRSVDVDSCVQLLRTIQPLPCTFHRAVDVANSWRSALSSVIQLGFDRVLTSGQQPTADAGCHVIQSMVEFASKRIVVMPGSGINKANLERIIVESGATEFHASASKEVWSQSASKGEGCLTEFDAKVKLTELDRVANLVKILTEYRQLN